MSKVHVLFKFAKNPYGGKEIDTTSSSGIYKDLSPFILGPVYTPENLCARRMENLWQYSKVYRGQVDSNGEPLPSWFIWREQGFGDSRAHRYPKGKGNRPLYSYWGGYKLGYIEARKEVYAKVYSEAVEFTESYKELKNLYKEEDVLVLRDYDAYDHIKLDMSLKEVINNPNRIMGHAFVLAMMLRNELEGCLND